jgi:hypothetical protein
MSLRLTVWRAIIAAYGVIFAAFAVRAEVAEPKVITLSCDGTVTDSRAADPKPEAVNKMGLVVDLSAQTVAGFSGIVAHIDYVDAASISFRGIKNLTAPDNGTPVTAESIMVMGQIDRVTGTASATTMSTVSVFNFDLLCKPTSRLF